MNRLLADPMSVPTEVENALPERHAALLLHAMNARDRDWALARLAPAERERMGPLLAELHDLGVPADRRWLAQALESRPAKAECAAPQHRLAGATAERMVQVLLAELAALVKRVLALGPWPWSEEVLAALRSRRGELFEPSTEPTMSRSSPALDAALLARLAALAGGALPPPASAEGTWARWRGRLGRWRGPLR